MRNVLGAAAVLFSTIVYTTTATAECFCGEESFFYTTVNPADVDWMEDFPWAVHSIAPVLMENFSGEQVQTCYVQVNLVTEDNPALDSYIMTDDGQDTIYFNGIWTPYSSFEEQVGPNCLGGIS